jgi:hypothetical protein
MNDNGHSCHKYALVDCDICYSLCPHSRWQYLFQHIHSELPFRMRCGKPFNLWTCHGRFLISLSKAFMQTTKTINWQDQILSFSLVTASLYRPYRDIAVHHTTECDDTLLFLSWSEWKQSVSPECFISEIIVSTWVRFGTSHLY